MPHDMKGKKLKVGDKVMVPCRVEQIFEGAQTCNLQLRTVAPMPGQETGDAITTTACLVKKSEAKG